MLVAGVVDGELRGMHPDPNLGVKTNFDPPTNWDGTCNGEKAIPAAMMCGGVPCVKSIVVAPPVIKEEACEPFVVGHPELPPAKVWAGQTQPASAWGGGPDTPIGRACAPDGPPPSCSEKVCTPSSSGFRGCLLRDGDHACPPGWDDRHLLYSDIRDERQCSECTCGEPSEGFCQIQYGIYSDPACTTIVSIELVSTAMEPPCRDFMGGTALASKSAHVVEYKKGTCAPSGGELVGELILDGAATVCCSAPTT